MQHSTQHSSTTYSTPGIPPRTEPIQPNLATPSADTVCFDSLGDPCDSAPEELTGLIRACGWSSEGSTDSRISVGIQRSALRAQRVCIQVAAHGLSSPYRLEDCGLFVQALRGRKALLCCHMGGHSPGTVLESITRTNGTTDAAPVEVVLIVHAMPGPWAQNVDP